MEPFKLTELPYSADALTPVVSASTISFHHGKHLQTYVANLNAAIAGTKYEGLSLEDIVRTSEGGIFNNAGQILNHNFYFLGLQPPVPDNHPIGKLADAIVSQFGSFNAFKQEFIQKGTSLFGSGWVWLSCDNDGSLVITQEQNAQNPVQRGLNPLLTFDVWEHAYYLDYQNRRADHLTAMWQLVNWNEIDSRFIG